MTDTEKAVDRTMGEYEPGKPYPFAGILAPSAVERRLNYTATAAIIAALIYIGWRVCL